MTLCCCKYIIYHYKPPTQIFSFKHPLKAHLPSMLLVFHRWIFSLKWVEVNVWVLWSQSVSCRCGWHLAVALSVEGVSITRDHINAIRHDTLCFVHLALICQEGAAQAGVTKAFKPGIYFSPLSIQLRHYDINKCDEWLFINTSYSLKG